MFAGHVGAGLALARAERRVNVSVFVTAALLLDLLLWVFVLLGWESVIIPTDFSTSHQAGFNFPWSHGLLAALCWAAIATGVGYAMLRRLQAARLGAAVLIGAAVMSHWLLDALVHAPELPLAGAGGAKIGLGLWAHMPVALVLEAIILLLGLFLFMQKSGFSRLRVSLVVTLCLILLGLTIAGMTIAPAPPSPIAMALSSLLTLILVCALVGWLDARPAGPNA